MAFIERLVPEKPIVVGLYMCDYGVGRRMPWDIYEQQCQTSLRRTHAEQIEGMVFMTINDDAHVLQWTADWIAEVGDLENR